jgi:hypothetical protein
LARSDNLRNITSSRTDNIATCPAKTCLTPGGKLTAKQRASRFKAMRVRQPLRVDAPGSKSHASQASDTSLVVRANQALVPGAARPSGQDGIPPELRSLHPGRAGRSRTSYCPSRRYDGVVHLVQVPDSRCTPLCVSRWHKHCANLLTWQGPWNHMTILDNPHVVALAQWWASAVATTAWLHAAGAKTDQTKR